MNRTQHTFSKQTHLLPQITHSDLYTDDTRALRQARLRCWAQAPYNQLPREGYLYIPRSPHSTGEASSSHHTQLVLMNVASMRTEHVILYSLLKQQDSEF